MSGHPPTDAAGDTLPVKELIPTRRSLLTRLKKWDDQKSWLEFFNTYWKLIYGVARHAGLHEDEAQDIVQETMISVARQLPCFEYNSARGSFKSWLFLITRRRIADHLRRKYRQVKTVEAIPRTASRTGLLERLPDPTGAELEALWEKEWRAHILEQALQRLKKQVELRHFQMFDCYVLKGWPVQQVVAAFGVKPGQVYLVKHRLSEHLAAEIKRLEAGA